jgi:alpha-L-rhamnosidase
VVFWFYHHLAGIRHDPAEPGYGSIVIQPEFHPELAPLKATHETRYGTIEAGWTHEDGQITYSFTTPPGTRARLKLPSDCGDISLDGQALDASAAAEATGEAGLAVAPGSRTVTLRLAA